MSSLNCLEPLVKMKNKTQTILKFLYSGTSMNVKDTTVKMISHLLNDFIEINNKIKLINKKHIIRPTEISDS